VVALIAALRATGIALAATSTASDWPVIAAKAVLLAAASALFWWVSWRAWPRRVFALPDELPGLQRRFRSAAITMLALVGAAFVLSYLS
jgi:hypothetical protein